MPRKRRCAPQPSLRSPQPVRMVGAGVHLSVQRVHLVQYLAHIVQYHARLGVLVVDLACLACLMSLDMCLAQRRQPTERRDTGVEPRADVISAGIRVLLGGGARERGQERGVATLAARCSDALPRRQAVSRYVSRTGRDTQRGGQGLPGEGCRVRAIKLRQTKADHDTTWLGGAARHASSYLGSGAPPRPASGPHSARQHPRSPQDAQPEKVPA